MVIVNECFVEKTKTLAIGIDYVVCDLRFVILKTNETIEEAENNINLTT